MMHLGLAIGTVVLSLASAPGSVSSTPRQPLAKRALVEPTSAYRVVVKFSDSLAARIDAAGRLESRTGQSLATVRELMREHDVILRPLFAIDHDRIDALRSRARARSGRAQPDLLATYVLHSPTDDRDALLRAARALQVSAQVEFVSLEALAPPPPIDLDPPTPNLVEFQGYAGPRTGIDAHGAWAMGYDGTGIRLSDVEYGWLVDHEEWNEGQLIPEPGQTTDYASLEGIADGNHGTAVAGELIAGDNGYGVTGLSPGSTLGVYPTLTLESGSRRAEAIASAAADSSAGDVILLEMQIGETITGQLGPAELEESVWMATRVATDAGLVVVAAAGNGNLDLDRDELAYYRDRGDSGAIVVGAGEPGTRERLGFSSYGSRVNVQGWGTQVFTTGYGAYEAFGDDPNQSYTNSFGGTSSASPIVAAAASLVQQAVVEQTGAPLTSQQMRAVLAGTGLPQPGPEENVGPLPQVPAAIAAGVVPQTEPPQVAITSPGATQTEESTFATTITVEASGDTAQVQLSINGELQSVVDDVPPFEFAEVVFPEGTWQVVAVATNIWNNEASSETVVLEVGYEPPPPNESTGDSSGGVGEVGTAGDTTGEPDPDPDPDPDPGSSEGSGSTDGEPEQSSDSGGCGCTAPTSPSPFALLCVAALGLMRRRRLHPRR